MSPKDIVSDPRVEAVGRFVSRYRPFLITVLAILLIAVFLPGRSDDTTGAEEAASLTAGVGETAAGEDGVETTGDGAPVTEVTTGTSGAKQAAREVAERVAGVAGKAKQLVANCDPKTGLIKIPSFGAPPCVERYTGKNAGASYQGVTKDKIVVVYYLAQEDPAADAILKAAGADDSREDVIAQVKDWVKFYSAHFNMWGRTIDLRFVDGSAAATDDAAGKSDAIKVATQHKAFVSINSPNNTYVDELVARGVMCMCTVELPRAFYEKRAPYVWTTLQTGDQTYQLLTEYIVKRLNNKNAKWAGDPLFQNKKRVFGLLQYETKDFAYGSSGVYFQKQMAKHGIKLVIAKFNGYPDLQANQVQARPVIQRMREAGVTTLICGCDPFAPIFFTQEATRQVYRPEWIDVGSALTDTSFFARTYDKEQWSHAFGLGQLFARIPEKLSDSHKLHTWHFGRTPVAEAGYAVIRAPMDIFFRGVHMAGPSLTPKTFQKGLFSHPVIGKGHISIGSISFGSKIWGFDDYSAFDDVTEIWWDNSARGEDEIGNDGVGLWRYVNMGKRYLPGQWPRTEPFVFNTKNTVTIYNTYPKGDKPPDYPSPKK
jgi:hypothetical protein